MKSLIVENDFTSRLLLQEILKPYGAVHIAVNGQEAVAAVRSAMDAAEPYDLVCLDIMMAGMDGHEALQQIRACEESRGIHPPEGAKIFMTSTPGSMKNVFQGFRELCNVYLVKPVDKTKLLAHLREFGLTQPPAA